MNTKEILKKLEEIKVNTLNNLTSDDKKSKLQVESATEEPLDEDAAGEDTKKDPIDEKVKDPYFDKLRALSRVTPMDGAESPPEGIYTSGEKKAITTESIQVQLDDLKKNLIYKTPFNMEQSISDHQDKNRKNLYATLSEFMEKLDNPLKNAIVKNPMQDIYEVESAVPIGPLIATWASAHQQGEEEAKDEIADDIVEKYKLNPANWNVDLNKMNNMVTFKRR